MSIRFLEYLFMKTIHLKTNYGWIGILIFALQEKFITVGNFWLGRAELEFPCSLLYIVVLLSNKSWFVSRLSETNPPTLTRSERRRGTSKLRRKFPRQGNPHCSRRTSANFVYVADIVESRFTPGNYKHREANNYYYCLPHYPSGSSRSCKRLLRPKRLPLRV